VKCIWLFFNGGNNLSTNFRHVKFCMEIDYKHTYKFCMKYILCGDNYEHDSVKF
jgi:hypothetical protein